MNPSPFTVIHPDPNSKRQNSWLTEDSGRLPAQINMDLDRQALDAMGHETHQQPRLRFFQWTKPVITYGYLLDQEKVKKWSEENNNLEMVQRPTGGGAVIHNRSELSLSILWPRCQNILPEKPRDCYEEIHKKMHTVLHEYLKTETANLFIKPANSCAEPNTPPNGRFSVCFQEPVCNDIMINNKKVVGGALRITKKAILYQGAIQLDQNIDIQEFKRSLRLSFTSTSQT